MKEAVHLAGGLSLALDAEVTWSRMDTHEAIEFQCNGHHSYVAVEDLVALPHVPTPKRRALFERVKAELEGS